MEITSKQSQESGSGTIINIILLATIAAAGSVGLDAGLSNAPNDIADNTLVIRW